MGTTPARRPKPSLSRPEKHSCAARRKPHYPSPLLSNYGAALREHILDLFAPRAAAGRPEAPNPCWNDSKTALCQPPSPHVSPAFGPLSGGGGVEIVGSNFTGTTLVSFGATNTSNYEVVSDTEIMAEAPAHTAALVDITVTAPSGTSSTSQADQYSYLPASTSPLLYSSANPSVPGQSVTLSATVNNGGQGAPTGQITVEDATTVLGASTLTAGGQATFTTASLTVGSLPITAVYGGDLFNAASTSGVLN